MNWILFAILSVFLVGIFNVCLEATKETIPAGFTNKHMYLCSILVVAGIIGGFILVYYSVTKPADFSELFTGHLRSSYWLIFLPAIILCTYLVTNTLALSNGGGIATAIISMNMFVTIIMGTMLFGDKINDKILLSLIVGASAIGYGAYESHRLNDN
jgi:drug/metabolite transporter (DMT)-like permease